MEKDTRGLVYHKDLLPPVHLSARTQTPEESKDSRAKEHSPQTAVRETEKEAEGGTSQPSLLACQCSLAMEDTEVASQHEKQTVLRGSPKLTPAPACSGMNMADFMVLLWAFRRILPTRNFLKGNLRVLLLCQL